MDEKKLIESKLMEKHSEYKEIMAPQNPYKYGADGWIEWQMEQSRKRRENLSASAALARELFKGEGNVPTEEEIDRFLAPARKRMAEEREKYEQFKKQHFKKTTASNNNQVDKEAKQPGEVETITQNDDTVI